MEVASALSEAKGQYIKNNNGLRKKIEALIEHHEGHGIAIDYDDTDVIRILKSLLRYGNV